MSRAGNKTISQQSTINQQSTIFSFHCYCGTTNPNDKQTKTERTNDPNRSASRASLSMKKGKANVSPQMRQQYKRAQEMEGYRQQMQDSQVRTRWR